MRSGLPSALMLVLLVGVGLHLNADSPAAPKRPPLTTSTVVGSPEPPTPYRAQRLYPNLSPSFPVAVNAIPGTNQLLYITQSKPYMPTQLWRVEDAPNVKTAEAVKLMDSPPGALVYDFCFHPNFATNGYVYLGWNGDGKGKRKNKFSRVTRYHLTPKPPHTLDVASAKLIIEWESHGHNGAAICFGTDGYLYVTTGDGTADSDADVMGQSMDTLLSKVLRIDVNREDAGRAYAIPRDNPFADGKQFPPETWATGTRNPWRITCDEKTGRIWIGNNGQDLWETAHLVRPRDNYGWSKMEGGHIFYESRKTNSLPLTPPTIEHHHSEFRSLTGGIVYHGEKLPELNGVYLYGDYSTGRVWGMKHDGTKAIWHKELATPRFQLTCFARNTRGELLICDHRSAGESGFYTLVPNTEAPTSKFPRKLSESGLFDDVAKHVMKPGVVPYEVNAPFWSDGLFKARYIAIPDDGNTAVPIDATRSRGWNFPDRTVIVKSFAHETEASNAASRKWIETRFMTKQGGEWFGYTYQWNADGTDAELVPSSGRDVELTTTTSTGARTQTWRYPSRSECMVCHSRAANFVLGVCELQLNKETSQGNQLRVFERMGLIAIKDPKPTAQPITASSPLPADYKKLVDPFDTKQDLTLRAKSWLHSNCSSCHVEAGGGNAQIDLEFTTPLDTMRIVEVKPIHHAFDIPDAKLIAPGEPEKSVLIQRIKTRGPRQMPPLASHVVDERGLALLTEWVRSLKK
jgi:uncharacterized repeat protein (TIGR03806 family)